MGLIAVTMVGTVLAGPASAAKMPKSDVCHFQEEVLDETELQYLKKKNIHSGNYRDGI